MNYDYSNCPELHIGNYDLYAFVSLPPALYMADVVVGRHCWAHVQRSTSHTLIQKVFFSFMFCPIICTHFVLCFIPHIIALQVSKWHNNKNYIWFNSFYILLFNCIHMYGCAAHCTQYHCEPLMYVYYPNGQSKSMVLIHINLLFPNAVRHKLSTTATTTKYSPCVRWKISFTFYFI